MEDTRRRPGAFAAVALALLAPAFAVNLWAPGLLLNLVPDCPFLALTGLECPLCGSARALSSLGRGEWRAALAFNPLAVLALPAALVLAGLMSTRRGAGLLRGTAGRWIPGAAIVLAAGLWLWRILRG